MVEVATYGTNRAADTDHGMKSALLPTDPLLEPPVQSDTCHDTRGAFQHEVSAHGPNRSIRKVFDKSLKGVLCPGLTKVGEDQDGMSSRLVACIQGG